MRAAIVAMIALTVAAGPDGAELDRKQSAGLERRLEELIEKKHAIGLHDLIQELKDIADPDAARWIIRAALAVPSAENYRLATESLSEADDDARRELLDELLGGKEAKKTRIVDKLLIVDAIALREDDESLEKLIGLAKDDGAHHNLRLAAIRGLVARKRKEAVPALIDVVDMQNELEDRVWLDAREGLRTLTGRDFDTVEDWRNYWSGAADTLDPARLDAPRDLSKTVVGKKPIEFFGQALYSNNLIFVIDVSSSMLKYDLRDDYRGTNPERDLQRLYLAQKQLIATLRKLPKSARFNIVAYSDVPVPWKRSLQKVGSSSISSAATFVASLRASGFTHTDEALALAFTDPDVDTIVLLSDGNPSKAKSTSSYEVIEKTLSWLDEAIVSRRIRIDTFGITSPGKWPAVIPDFRGQPPPPPSDFEVESFIDFLTNLSEKSGGVFRPLE